MDTFAARLTQARKRRGLSQLQLAHACGWDSQSRISQYEQDKREPRAADLELLARALDVAASWLQFGEQTAAGTRMVPLVSWVAAGGWQMSAESVDTNHTDQWVEAHARVSDQAFALRVRGDSMSPDFPDGATIIVDPKRPAVNGAMVVARFDNDTEATFKQLVKDGGRTFLKPINPRYPVLSLEENSAICGVVVEMTMHRIF